MAKNKGKAFESKFKECWFKTFPESFLLRLQDQMTGYKVTSQNPCDFIGFVNNTLFLLECKSHLGKSFPFSVLTQYDKLAGYCDMKNVRVGAVIWLIDYDKIYYLPISTVTKILKSNIKSFNPSKLDPTEYKYIEIPSVKLRTYFDSDYSILLDLKEGD